MATYYARNTAGNWSANTSWDAAASTGAGPAGPPVAGDTAIFDANYTGNITIGAAAACATLTCLAGATGTLTWGTYTLTCTGNITFVSGFNLAGSTGTLTISTAANIAMGGLTFPGNINFNVFSGTETLLDALTVAGTIFLSGGFTFAGNFDITCGTLNVRGNGVTNIFKNGQSVIVQTSLLIAPGTGYATSNTLRSSTSSSDAFLHFNGAAADCKVVGAIFTDINCAHAIDNWYGGTLLRTTGITNRTSADMATAAQAAKILDDTTISGITGTMATRTLSAANETVNAGYYAETTLSAVDTDLAAANIVSGKTIFGFAGSAAGGGGIFMPAARQIGV
jgi:hypothetical protein